MDRGEFERLLTPLLEMGYRYALRLTGNPDEAMDLMQDASLQAFRARHTFQSGTNFKAWFFKILTNLFYQTRAKRKPETVSLDDAPDLYLYDHVRNAGGDAAADDPAAWFFNRFEMDKVDEALEKLPEDYRQVAILYFVSDMSYEEIAETLDVPIGTVRSRLHRARKQLQISLWDLADSRGWLEAEEAS